MRTIPVLTPEQSRAWDRAAESAGRPLRMLMENAGRAVAQLVTDRLAMAASQGVLVACGPGNNGGDGWVAARALRATGVPVWATEVAPPPGGIAADARTAALEDGVRLVPVDGPWPGIGLMVDALLGTGASGAPRGAMMPLLQRMWDLDKPIVAVDGPTGLDLATGVQHGPLHAALTITFPAACVAATSSRVEIGDLVVGRVQHLADLSGDRLAAERLLQQRPVAVQQLALQDHVVGVAGRKEYLDIRSPQPRLFSDFAAAHSRQHDVGEQQVNLTDMCIAHAGRLGAVSRFE